MAESALCFQEMEDNKINEIREAKLRNSPNDVKAMTEDNSQSVQTITGSHSINAIKTGAIPKSGFSYLSNIANTDGNRAFLISKNEYVNNVHPLKQVSQPATHSRNAPMYSDNSEVPVSTQTVPDNDKVKRNAPRKLKPEVFSFLNKLQQRNVFEGDSDISKEKITLIPTVFSHTEKLGFSPSQGNIVMEFDGSSDAFVKEIPSAPSLENITNNYESITEESFSEIALPLVDSTIAKENMKPPLPVRPPPVFKYPPETFSSLGPISTESTSNVAVSQLLSRSTSTCPKLGNPISSTDSDISQPILRSSANQKLGHSISSLDSGLKNINVGEKDRVLSSKMNNKKSLPPTPKKPLPPLPLSDREHISGIRLNDGTNKLEVSDSINKEKWSEEAPKINGTISSQTNQLPIVEASIHHTAYKDHALQEQLISSPQQRLAQILTNQISADNKILLSQAKKGSAISKVTGSISSLQTTEDSNFHDHGRAQELIETMPGRSLDNDAERMIEDESERQSSYLEAVNPRRFTDHEALINAMNRPVLPQKAAPIQRSVSCNSLVQSIKDLSFSVWSGKSEKKRNSDGLSLSKKSSRNLSVTNSSKITAPLPVRVIPKDAPSEVISLHHGKKDEPILDEKSELREHPWFHDVEAKEGQLRLLCVGQDGTFLIRPSSRPTEDIQNTMCILYNGKVRNLHVRRITDGRYVLGTKTSKSFASLTEMIRHHQEVPVEILPHGSTPLKPRLYKIILRDTPPKLQKVFEGV